MKSRFKFWAKARIAGALTYPDLKVGVIETIDIEGLQPKIKSFCIFSPSEPSEIAGQAKPINLTICTNYSNT